MATPTAERLAIYERLAKGLLRLHSRKDVSEADKELLVDAVNRIMWDDAIHITAPWDDRVTLCGSWDRNRTPLSEPRPDGMAGCWTCLLTADWLDAHPFVEGSKT